jgi:Double zinc ribbon
MDDLDRLFRRLVHNMRIEYPAYLTSAFPVAELYQSVVPYRHNRSALEIEVHEDYDVALTRLLSGERGYVISDPAMQEGLASVLTSGGSAITYRAYAAAMIELAPDAVRRLDEEQSRAGERPMTPTVSPAVRPKATAPVSIVSDGPCLFCGGTFPPGLPITFCPHCGQNVTVKLCPACSAELEVTWKFCPTCGRGVDKEESDKPDTAPDTAPAKDVKAAPSKRR